MKQSEYMQFVPGGLVEKCLKLDNAREMLFREVYNPKATVEDLHRYLDHYIQKQKEFYQELYFKDKPINYATNQRGWGSTQ